VITLPDKRRVTIMVVAIRGDSVRIGIEADTDIPIHRDEIQAEIDGLQGRRDDGRGRAAGRRDTL
jgi:carbon storage regulator CsrA